MAHDVYHRLDPSHFRIILPCALIDLKSQNLWYTIPIRKQYGVCVQWIVIVLISLCSIAWTAKSHPLTILINDYRKSWNAPYLTEDPHLTCAAEIHLEHITRTRTCTHIGASGSTVRDRAIACGYGWSTGEQLILCQYLTEDAWFNTLRVYPKEYRVIRDHSWQKIGVAGEALWWVVILAR